MFKINNKTHTNIHTQQSPIQNIIFQHVMFKFIRVSPKKNTQQNIHVFNLSVCQHTIPEQMPGPRCPHLGHLRPGIC